MVPRTVLTRSGPISVNAVRPVNTVQSRTTVNNAGPIKIGTRVNTARPKAVLSAVKGINGNGNPQQDLKNKGVIDSRCSRHVIRNKSYRTNYKEIDGGFVAFGGNSKGGKLQGKVRVVSEGETEKEVGLRGGRKGGRGNRVVAVGERDRGRWAKEGGGSDLGRREKGSVAARAVWSKGARLVLFSPEGAFGYVFKQPTRAFVGGFSSHEGCLGSKGAVGLILSSRGLRLACDSPSKGVFGLG
ncbi:hypothetical protein Tco_1310532 [Tanacetum coccineum]